MKYTHLQFRLYLEAARRRKFRDARLQFLMQSAAINGGDAARLILKALDKD